MVFFRFFISFFILFTCMSMSQLTLSGFWDSWTLLIWHISKKFISLSLQCQHINGINYNLSSIFLNLSSTQTDSPIFFIILNILICCYVDYGKWWMNLMKKTAKTIICDVDFFAHSASVIILLQSTNNSINRNSWNSKLIAHFHTHK